MQVDGVHSLPAGDEDDGSLFGSPPPSPPARGRSPQLALPAGPGSAENVGTIALPGSHYRSELAIDPAVLFLNRPLSTRNPDMPTFTPTTVTTNTTTTTSTPTPTPTLHPLTPSSIPNAATKKPPISRGSSRGPKNSKSGKERSTTPRPPPPIHFPDPNEPPPSNFLRSQQALLGHAGLIGGLDPSTLSTRHHKGVTSKNPIIVEDELDPPRLGKKGPYSLDSSSLPSPSNEEVVSSLVKQKNIFPVLESLLRLLSGREPPNVFPATQSSSPPGPNGSSDEHGGVAHKRRRLNTVPAGAADWDVPYPFQQGEGPSQYRVRWEKERLKQLISQLAVLIKGARRSAAARTYIQQRADSSSPMNPPNHPDQIPFQQRPSADMPFCQQQDMPAFSSEVQDVASVRTVPPPRTPEAFSQTARIDEFIASLHNSIPPASSPSNQTSYSPFSEFSQHCSPVDADATALDAIPVDLEQLFAMFRHSPSPCTGGSTDSPGVEVPTTSHANQADQHLLYGTPMIPGDFPDSMIDPVLLGMPFNSNLDLVDPSRNTFPDGQGPSTPMLLQSPIASTSSLFDPLTPTEDLNLDPEVYRPEQGRFQPSSHRPRVPQGLVDAIAEDPISAAALLMQIAKSASLSATAPSKSQLLPLPASRPLSIEPRTPVPALSPRPFPTSTATTTARTSRASSAVPRQDPAVSAIAPTTQILSLLDKRGLSQVTSGNKTLNKQDLIRRAKDRRKHLVAELEKAKVELWEATIEQGVLNHLMKDSSCT